MSFKRTENGTTFKRARAHRSYSLEERPTPQPPPKIIIRRKAAKKPEPEAAKPKPKKPVKVWTLADTREDLAAEAKRRKLKVTTRTTKKTLVEMLQGREKKR